MPAALIFNVMPMLQRIWYLLILIFILLNKEGDVFVFFLKITKQIHKLIDGTTVRRRKPKLYLNVITRSHSLNYTYRSCSQFIKVSLAQHLLQPSKKRPLPAPTAPPASAILHTHGPIRIQLRFKLNFWNNSAPIPSRSLTRAAWFSWKRMNENLGWILRGVCI